MPRRRSGVITRTAAAVAAVLLAGGTGSATAAWAMSTSYRPVDAGPARVAKSADLTILYRAAATSSPRRMQLRCNPSGGDQPRAAEACATLAMVDAEGLDPFAETRGTRVCSVGYAGPQTAQVSGQWGNASVRARFARTNGCEVARWNLIEPVLDPVPLR